MENKSREIFKVLEENGLFAQEFSFLFQLLQGRKLQEYKKSAWHIKGGELHWWDTFRIFWDSEMFISLSDNTVTFMTPSCSNLLQKIRDVAEHVTKETNFKAVIHHY